MANRSTRTPEKEETFLVVLRETDNVTEAARTAGVPRRTAYEWREADPDFAARWDEAVEEALDAMEREVRRRGLEGVDKPVFYQGAVCGSVREFSDTLLMFHLKARRPEKFRERYEVTSHININHHLDTSRLSTDQLRQLDELIDAATVDDGDGQHEEPGGLPS